MNTIGETIANLRKKHKMTQEQLAQIIGVSAQSVSKWGNGTNMPDIMLLPIIADIFGVSVDYLFGRGGANVGNSINPDKCLEKTCDSIMETLASSCYDSGFSESFDEFFRRYRNTLKSNTNNNSAVFRNHGTVFYNDSFGGLVIKRPHDGWSSLFECQETANAISLFADEDIRRIFCKIIKTGMNTFTLSHICKLSGIENSAAIAEKLEKTQIFRKNKIDVDGEIIDIYQPLGHGRQFFLVAIYALAKAYTEYKDQYVCFHGDINAFSDITK